MPVKHKVFVLAGAPACVQRRQPTPVAVNWNSGPSLVNWNSAPELTAADLREALHDETIALRLLGDSGLTPRQSQYLTLDQDARAQLSAGVEAARQDALSQLDYLHEIVEILGATRLTHQQKKLLEIITFYADEAQRTLRGDDDPTPVPALPVVGGPLLSGATLDSHEVLEG